jgi:hypothetical protein
MKLRYDSEMTRTKLLWWMLAMAALAGTFIAYGQADLLINWVNAKLC